MKTRWFPSSVMAMALLCFSACGGSSTAPPTTVSIDGEHSEWTWVTGADYAGQPGTYGTKGVADPSNVPGARSDAVSWNDDAGNLWLFGGGDGHNSSGDLG